MTNHNYRIEWVLISLATCICAASFLLDYFACSNTLFSRSGSLVVLFAVIVEYRIAPHIYDEIQKILFLNGKLDLSMPLKPQPTKQKKNISKTAHIYVILGTVIWGYGDLIPTQA